MKIENVKGINEVKTESEELEFVHLVCTADPTYLITPIQSPDDYDHVRKLGGNLYIAWQDKSPDEILLYIGRAHKEMKWSFEDPNHRYASKSEHVWITDKTGMVYKTRRAGVRDGTPWKDIISDDKPEPYKWPT